MCFTNNKKHSIKLELNLTPSSRRIGQTEKSRKNKEIKEYILIQNKYNLQSKSKKLKSFRT